MCGTTSALATSRIAHSTMRAKPGSGVSCAQCKARRECSSTRRDTQSITGRIFVRLGRCLILSRTEGKSFYHGSTPEEVMHWWIHNADYDTQTVQTSLEGIFD